MITFTTADKHRAVMRELGFRRHVYPRRVAEGKMSQQQADEQVAVFEAILLDYAKLMEGERLL
jgi:hypothetical protein